MGSWGVAIFADDVALDVRRDWRDAILDGVEPRDATAALEARYADALADRDDAVVFWLALAAAQMETGRLIDGVRERAAEIIDAGGDVARWRDEDEGLARRRGAVLARLRTRLLGPQSPPKQLRRPQQPTRFDVGDAIAVYGADREVRGVVVVVGHLPGAERATPIVEPLAWPPAARAASANDLEALPGTTVEVANGNDAQPVSKGLLLTVRAYTRGTEFGPHIGEVVARGVRRGATAELAAFHANSQDARARRLSRRPEARHPKNGPIRFALSWPQLAETLVTEALVTEAKERYAEMIALYEAARSA